jgi:2'-5' RNA ligase
MSIPDTQRRLFFALWPDAALAVRVAALASGRDGRPTLAVDLHLTVLFLGSVPESRVPAVVDAAAQIRRPAIRQPLSGIAFWPTPGILCAFGEPVPALIELRNAVKELANTLGVGSGATHEAFRPHVTVSRGMRGNSGAFIAPMDPLVLSADHFFLAESAPTQEGKRYRWVASWPLG